MNNILKRENVIIAFLKENWNALKEAIFGNEHFEEEKIEDEQLIKSLDVVEKIEAVFENNNNKKTTTSGKKSVVSKLKTNEIPTITKKETRVVKKESEKDRDI